jgi:hypothetical protein
MSRVRKGHPEPQKRGSLCRRRLFR